MFFSQLAGGMKLYCQKNDGLWYKGTLVEIKNRHADQFEVY